MKKRTSYIVYVATGIIAFGISFGITYAALMDTRVPPEILPFVLIIFGLGIVVVGATMLHHAEKSRRIDKNKNR